MTKGPYRDGKVHVLSAKCSTCIFRPGNLMQLRAGRVKDMVAGSTGNETAITCHQTLPYYSRDAQPAVCRGFFDRYKTQPLQIAERLGLIEYDDPPPKEA